MLQYGRYTFQGVEFEVVKVLNDYYDWIVAGKYIGTFSADQLPRYTNGMEIEHLVLEAET